MTVPPKKAAILRAGRPLLLRHGIRKTRVEEICADAKVSKRTFYKYFGDKEEFAIATLRDLIDAGVARLELVFALERPIAEKLRQIIEIKAELAAQTSSAFYREAVDESTAPGRYVIQRRRAWDQRIGEFWADAQTRGLIRGDLDLDVLMSIVAGCRRMVSDPDLVRAEPDLARRAEAVMKVFFYGIIPSPPAGEDDQ